MKKNKWWKFLPLKCQPLLAECAFLDASFVSELKLSFFPSPESNQNCPKSWIRLEFGGFETALDEKEEQSGTKLTAGQTDS